MTLDEAIKHAEEVVQENQYEYQECVAVHDMEGAKNCKKHAEEHRQLAEWLKDYKRLLEQQSCEDIEEIREVMVCDADAETKCKMIYNILNAKPHYFKNQEPCENVVNCEYLEECKELMTDINGDTVYAVRMSDIRNLPSVTPQPKTGHWIDDKCSVCGKGIEDLIDSYEWYRNEKPNFCPFCGAVMKGETE